MSVPLPPRNLLGQARSPYLLQHADNPVHWRVWGAAALAEARALGRPILLSIGYAACHWCHVMAHESFADAEIAAVMNALFVNIKVDREERPDIDHLYMTALHALGEQGGWPLTMFLTPEGDPFWGGTYFPPEPRWGRPSFRQVLEGVAGAFAEGAEGVARNAAALRRTLAAAAAAHPGAAPGPDVLDAAGTRLLSMVDHERGGLRGAPKFPNAPIFRFLWQDSFRTGRDEGRDAVRHLLAAMSAGGIHDHLGGGFARYSTDAEWLAPHFEKMLYDNALLLDLLALACAERPDQDLAEAVCGIVTWLQRDMVVAMPGGVVFAASEDADSPNAEGHAEEGAFYVWRAAEIAALLGPRAPVFAAAYDVTAAGNWEGGTILRRITPRGSEAEEAALAADRAVLLAARGARARPGRDDKVLADWNGLMIAALARAASVFARAEWLRLARGAFDAVMAAMGATDGRVAHAWRGEITAAGLLEDQAAMARAALALFEASGEAAYLAAAIALAEAAEGHFAAPDGGYFTTADDAADVPLGAAARPRSVADNATPSGIGMMAEVLARLWHVTGEARWRARAEGVLVAFGGLGAQLSAAPGLLAAADWLENGASVVCASEALAAMALAAPDPAVAVTRTGAEVSALHPAFGKGAVEGRPAAYVCRGGVCGLPVTEPGTLAAALRRRG